MDELLRGSHDLGAAALQPSLSERLLGLTAAVQEKAAAAWESARPVLRTVQTWAERHPLSPAVFLAVTSAVGAAALVGTIYTPSYVINLDGMDIGVVEDTAVYYRAASSVEARASRILGHAYTMEHEVSFSPALSERSAGFATAGQIETYLFNEIGDIVKGYVLTVDGVTIGAADSEGVLDTLLANVAAPYCTENTVDYGFVEDVVLRNDYITSDFNLDLDNMFATLTENTTGETTYEVVQGDTYLDIAAANDMSLDELMALNPQASLNRLMVGDILNVKKIIPYLSVYTVDRETYHQPIDSPVEYVDDASLYIGDTRVITQGAQGEALVTANVTYVNGYESERTVVESTTLTEPTVTVMAQGTTERPRTASTGAYHWPIYGRINSRFGYRTGFGSRNHQGIDINAAYGATICASDGGLVTYAGWLGGYGNLVVITHDSGSKTYYGHNSSLLVSVGERVYQGQAIARAGSTGNSSGPHCHFEVRINGTPVNPLSYLA